MRQAELQYSYHLLQNRSLLSELRSSSVPLLLAVQEYTPWSSLCAAVMLTVSKSSCSKLLNVPTPTVMGMDPLLNVICGLGKPEVTHRTITDVPLSRQGERERIWRPVT